MNNLSKNIKIIKKRREKQVLSKESLQSLSQEELIDKLLKLDAHNLQLQSIIQKINEPSSKELSKEQKKIDFNSVSKRHVFLKFYYFGWDYQGYVTQEDTNNTIEYYLFKALEKCCLIENRESSNYHRCGRTDKGVSAFCQVISIDLRSKLSHPDENNQNEELPYCSMLNKLLPNNIRCYSWAHVSSNISSRFDCSWRMYKYYFPKGNLNIDLMKSAAKFLIGTHDFRNFCKMDVGNGVIEFQREIKFVDINNICCSPKKEHSGSGYEMYEFLIQGKGFLWHQIRCIMGVLMLVGQGKESPEVVKHLLNIEENPTKPQYSMANHLPLNLYKVAYEDINIKWISDEENLCKIIQLLQSQWTDYAIKSTMIKQIIDDLEKSLKNSLEIKNQAESLLDGVKSKVYKPLLSRMKCDSLENKISHYVKKRKLQITDDEIRPS